MDKDFSELHKDQIDSIKLGITHMRNAIRSAALEVVQSDAMNKEKLSKIQEKLKIVYDIEKKNIITSADLILANEILDTVGKEVELAKSTLSNKNIKKKIPKNINKKEIQKKVIKRTVKIRKIMSDDLENALSAGQQRAVSSIKKLYFDRLKSRSQNALIRSDAMRALAKESVKGGTLKSALKGLPVWQFPTVEINGRNYDAKKFIDMQLRTHSAILHTESVMETADSFNADLVQVSSHSTRYPICIPYEGKVFSLSGRDKRFPLLDRYPPFHPNCLHSIHVTFEEALEAIGQLQDAIDFANDKIEKPPGDTGFIPLNERKMIVPLRKK